MENESFKTTKKKTERNQSQVQSENQQSISKADPADDKARELRTDQGSFDQGDRPVLSQRKGSKATSLATKPVDIDIRTDA